jgi:hypothetical protein
MEKLKVVKVIHLPEKDIKIIRSFNENNAELGQQCRKHNPELGQQHRPRNFLPVPRLHTELSQCWLLSHQPINIQFEG